MILFVQRASQCILLKVEGQVKVIRAVFRTLFGEEEGGGGHIHLLHDEFLSNQIQSDQFKFNPPPHKRSSYGRESVSGFPLTEKLIDWVEIYTQLTYLIRAVF